MHDLIQSEDGAVTANWVVLTAGIVGLGLAATSVVSGGVEDQSVDIAQFLADTEVGTAFSRLFSENDFSEGRGDWSGGELMTINGFGEILALSGNATRAEMPISVDSKYAYAVMEFDMIIGDSWDNEQGVISINGKDVVIGTHSWGGDGPAIQTFDAAGGTTVMMTRSSTATGGNWRPDTNDYTYNVRVVAANDGSDITLGAATTLNQGGGDEFFGIDNVKVTGSNQK
ncbi:hypothetical protein SAMN05444004_106198 [Jannaschia faecimaris]|uniref:Uncharacterized protein n=1 Tax=Jannaschia faecimaris TaxID=1244108 RepID=A0A1H3QN65_9RHOB|nr:hypothetical protein [Jannaschia faecimaris]SDZ14149.1 hypothetical protein SAMN05444004_106198 [Jannaschia faecimaris]